MQLNDVIKSIGWYQEFVALPIQTDTTKNSTYTNTGIGVSASLQASLATEKSCLLEPCIGRNGLKMRKQSH